MHKNPTPEYLDFVDLAIRYDIAKNNPKVKSTEAIYVGRHPVTLSDKACYGATADIAADDGTVLMVHFHGDEDMIWWCLPRHLFWIPAENPLALGVK